MDRVASYGAFTLALRSNGTVWAWGENGYYQLGDGTNIDRYQPVQIPGLTGVVDLEAGYLHSFAVKRDGTLVGWGQGGNGMLGTDPTISSTSAPIRSSTVNDVVAVAAGSNHTVILKGNGTVWGFGYNGYGQLGIGITADRSFAVRAGSLDRIVSITAGYHLSGAVRNDGKVFLWGYNPNGQIGDGGILPQYNPVEVATSGTSISSGVQHTAIITQSGTIQTWGANQFGQLGDGTNYVRLTPTDVPDLTLGEQVARPTFSLPGGKYWQTQQVEIECATPGAAIRFTLDGSEPTSTSPLFAAGSSVTISSSKILRAKAFKAGLAPSHSTDALYQLNLRLEAGSGFSLAVLSDHSVWSWGGNGSGQLGLGDANQRVIPQRLIIPVTVRSLAAGESHSLAAGTNGTVWSWGGNWSGQLGNRGTQSSNFPVLVSGVSGAKEVLAGANHSVALTTAGTVWSWGANSEGQLGLGTTTDTSFPRMVNIEGVTAVSAGNSHTLALKSDGTVWAWGANSYGQLGDGSNENRSLPVLIPGLQGVIAISAKAFHSYALHANGEVSAWGYNWQGELASSGFSHSNRPIRSSFLRQIVAISAGQGGGSAVTADGRVVTWGANGNGQAGNGTYNALPSLWSYATDFSGAVALAADTHLLAAKESGTGIRLWAWGANYQGQVGDGSSGVNRPLPIPVNSAILETPPVSNPGGDTDGDGVTNLAEFLRGTSPTSRDSDNDGLEDSEEDIAGTHPLREDSDNDGIKDGWEVANGFSPLASSDAMEDTDSDRIPNLFEFVHGTNPRDASSKPAAHRVVAKTGGQYTSLNQALAAAAPYDIIAVQKGTYTESLPSSVKPIVWLGELEAGGPGVRITPADNVIAVTITADTLMDGFRIGRVYPYVGKGLDLQKLSTSSTVPRIRIQNVVISDQQDHSSYLGSAIRISSADVVLSHVTVLNNYSSTGAAIQLDNTSSGALLVRNSILWNPGMPEEFYSDNTAAASVGSIIRGGQLGGLNLDPLLRADARLIRTSPAINQGLSGGPVSDLDGEARPSGSAPDSGADEFVDSDNDGLPNWLEAIGVTNPTASNDSDSLSNLAEYNLGSDPQDADSDDDGLDDHAEATAGTGVWNSDTDNDGIKDGWEVANGFSPLNSSDAMEDTDSDRIPNLFEFVHGTNPRDASSKPAAHRVVAKTGGQYTTLNQALAAAAPYDIIAVQKGTYTESLPASAKPIVWLGELEAGGPGVRITPADNVTAVSITADTLMDGFRIGRVYPWLGNALDLDTLWSSGKNSRIRLQNLVVSDQRNLSSFAEVIRIGSADVILSQVTVMRNKALAATTGGAIHIDETAGNLIIRNSILWNPEMPAEFYTSATATASSVGSVIRGGQLNGLNLDPLLRPDGRIIKTSPALNRGVEALSLDLDGEPRPFGSAPDSGADEFVDADNDGLPNWLEALGVTSASASNDSDSLNNLVEYNLGTDPRDADSDDDGLDDAAETGAGTDALNPDTDDDGLPDGWENEHGLDPTVVDDLGSDSDGDGLDLGTEFDVGTDPTNEDSDGDGFGDGVEVSHGTDGNDTSSSPPPGTPNNPPPPPPPGTPPVPDPGPNPPTAPPPPVGNTMPSMPNLRVLVTTSKIAHPKFGFPTFMPTDPPKRYLKFSERSSLSGGCPESPVRGSKSQTIDAETGEMTTTSSGVVEGVQTPVSPLLARSSSTVSSYDDPPNKETDCEGTMSYTGLLIGENTTENVKSIAMSKLPEYLELLDGTPLAYRDVWDDELGYSYQKVKFRFQWGEGTAEEARYPVTFLILFKPEDDPETSEDESVEGVEVVGQPVKWDGVEAQSPLFELDPNELKPGDEEGNFALLPIELVDTKDGILDDQVPQGTTITPAMRDVSIEPKKDANDKRPQTVAWIDPHGAANGKDPEMPWLTLRVGGTEEMGLKIRWKLKVEYKRPNGRKLPEDKVMIPDAEGWVTENLDGAVEIYNHAKWTQEIAQKGYFGGEAELVFQLLKADGSPLGEETKWSFYIGGKNPDPAKSRTFITEASNGMQPAMAWFAYAIAKHESKDYNGAGSRYNQFWNDSARFAKVDHHAGEVLWVNNPGEGPPKGFGLFQVTGNKSDATADIPRKQLWNWQDNVRGGLDIVAVKRGIADRYFARIQRRSAQHKTAFENCAPPDIQVGTHTFSSADAIQVYCYNGTGSLNGKPAPIDARYPFDPAKPCGLGADKRWYWNPHNVAGGEPYIRKVEREME